MAIKVLIDNVDRTNRIQYPSLNVQDNLNQRRDICDFVIKRDPDQDFIPELSQEVVVELNDNRIFGGIVTKVSQKVESVNHIIYDVQVSDFTQLLDRKLVLERFRNRTVSYIIDFLLDKYDTEGFTMTNVDGDISIGSISFNRITLSECIEKLADVTGYSWYVDYFKDIHFFAISGEMAPFNITDISKNYSWNSLTYSNDLTQLRNAVYIVGGEERGLERTEEFTGPTSLAEREYYRLANKFAETPTVTVEGVTQTVGTEFLASDENFDCMWDFQQKYIRFTEGNVPDTNDTVLVSGIPLFRVVGRVQNNASILEHGLYEHVIRDNSIGSREEARQRGNAELQAYKDGVIECRFRTNTPGLRSGQTININSHLRVINEDFIIQKAEFKIITQDFGEWRVSLATARTVGIIQFLQDLLRQRTISEGESDTLLSFLQFEDSAVASDTLGDFTVTSPPYMIMPEDPSEDDTVISNNPSKTPAVVNFFTIEDVV